MSKEPLDEIQWKNPEWISHFGLHTGNVLDYFSESPFYDRTSNNQVLRMQFQFQQVPPGANPSLYIQQKLKEMTGIEFIVAYYRDPDFWVIRKQRRLSLDEAQIMQDYYIIGANVYQAPKVFDILSSRLLSSVLSLKKSAAALNKMSKFNISDGTRIYRDQETVATGSASTTDGNTVSATLPNTVQATGTTPSLVTPLVSSAPNITGPSLPNNQNYELSEIEFDRLLNNVVSSSNAWTLLDQGNLYGKGSTVETLGVKVNLDST